MDVAELALDKQLTADRWLARAEPLATSFIRAFGTSLRGVAAMPAESLWALTLDDRSRAVLLGHPLWRHETANLNAVQAEAFATLEDWGFASIEVRDLYELDRAPFGIYRALAR